MRTEPAERETTTSHYRPGHTRAPTPGAERPVRSRSPIQPHDSTRRQPHDDSPPGRIAENATDVVRQRRLEFDLPIGLDVLKMAFHGRRGDSPGQIAGGDAG